MEPLPRSIRLTDDELETIKDAARQTGMRWTTFTRRAALAAARRNLTPATIDVGGVDVALTETAQEAP